jgi:hypothetical protein
MKQRLILFSSYNPLYIQQIDNLPLRCKIISGQFNAICN